MENTKNETVDTVWKFVITQTIAVECFEASIEHLRAMFTERLAEQYGKGANRSLQLKIDKKIKDEIKQFNIVSERYINTNKKMAKQFDVWSSSDLANEKINKVYDFLDTI